MTRAAKSLAQKLEVRGLMNCQFAIKDEELYIIEVNPRASRTVPFVSKTIGVPLAKLAAKVMSGMTLKELGFTTEVTVPYYTVKEAVFPWNRFQGIDVVLGPEMHSTGEVMGIDRDPDIAYLKSQISAFNTLPSEGKVFVSVNDRDKAAVLPIAEKLITAGFSICATKGTMDHLVANNITCERAYKVLEGQRPNIVDCIKNGDIVFIVNSPGSHDAREDEVAIRAAAVSNRISYCTNMSGAAACASAMLNSIDKETEVCTIQEYHAILKG